LSRPKPTIIATANRGHKELQVCNAAAIYAVFCQGQPIKLRTRQTDIYDGYKYLKTSFPEAGHAIRLARKLNQEFNTTDYTVVILTSGRTVEV